MSERIILPRNIPTAPAAFKKESSFETLLLVPLEQSIESERDIGVNPESKKAIIPVIIKNVNGIFEIPYKGYEKAGIKNIIRVTNFFFDDESDIDPHKGEENPEIPPFTVDRMLTRKSEAPSSRNLN